jgi:hypothetical protein
VGIVSLFQRAPRAGGPQGWEIAGGEGNRCHGAPKRKVVEHKKTSQTHTTPHHITLLTHLRCGGDTTKAHGNTVLDSDNDPTPGRVGWTRPSGRKYAWMIHSRWACVFAVSHGASGNDASRANSCKLSETEKFPTFARLLCAALLKRTSTDKSTRAPTA